MNTRIISLTSLIILFTQPLFSQEVEIITHIDTTYTTREVTDTIHETVSVTDSLDRRGHYVQFYLGGGYGSLGYGLAPIGTINGKVSGAPAAMVQLQYAYFFHKNVGIGVGLWFENNTSVVSLNGEKVFADMWDSDDLNGTATPEQYDHHADIHQWRERETLHTIALPISLQLQGWNERGTAGIFFDLGAAPAYAVMRDYRIQSGEIEHWGSYESSHSELHNTHEFRTIDYTDPNETAIQRRGSFSVKPTGIAFADLGALLRVNEQLDLMIGVYGHYSFLSVSDATKQSELGWYDSQNFPNLPMAEYKGVMPTELVKDGVVHPWQAGLKVGLHWHDLPKHNVKKETYSIHIDTLMQLSERYDTIVHSTATEQIQQSIDKLNRLYFEFDSYDINDEGKLFLQQIYEQLRFIPNKIIIGGHASKEGTVRHNRTLAYNRAKAVTDYLVSLGMDRSRIELRSYGSSRTNTLNTDNRLDLDRRVEIIVVE